LIGWAALVADQGVQKPWAKSALSAPSALAGQMFSGGQCWVCAGEHDAGGGGQERGEVRDGVANCDDPSMHAAAAPLTADCSLDGSRSRRGCGAALFVLVGFRDDRRLAVVLTFVVFVFVLVIVVVGVSRRHRAAQDGGEAPVDQACGEVLGDARDPVGLLLHGAISILGVRYHPITTGSQTWLQPHDLSRKPGVGDHPGHRAASSRPPPAKAAKLGELPMVTGVGSATPDVCVIGDRSC
jgi:hypothetical protein